MLETNYRDPFSCKIVLIGAKRPIAIASCVLFVLSLILVLSGTVPPFSEDTARAVNVSYMST